MHDLATLSAMQERLRNTTGPSLELDNRIHAWLRGDTGFEWSGHYYNCGRGPSYGGNHGQGIAPVTASVDAALGLVEKLLPGAVIETCNMHEGVRGGFARVLASDEFSSGFDWIGEFIPTPENRSTVPLAILSALIAALLQSADG